MVVRKFCPQAVLSLSVTLAGLSSPLSCCSPLIDVYTSHYPLLRVTNKRMCETPLCLYSPQWMCVVFTFSSSIRHSCKYLCRGLLDCFCALSILRFFSQMPARERQCLFLVIDEQFLYFGNSAAKLNFPLICHHTCKCWYMYSVPRKYRRKHF